MIYKTVTVKPRLINPIVRVKPSISQNIIPVKASVVTTLRSGDYEQYTGAYEFEAGEEVQTVPTDHLVLMDNIIIDPVPANYARMEWNGSTILFY